MNVKHMKWVSQRIPPFGSTRPTPSPSRKKSKGAYDYMWADGENLVSTNGALLLIAPSDLPPGAYTRKGEYVPDPGSSIYNYKQMIPAEPGDPVIFGKVVGIPGFKTLNARELFTVPHNTREEVRAYVDERYLKVIGAGGKPDAYSLDAIPGLLFSQTHLAVARWADGRIAILMPLNLPPGITCKYF